MRFGFLLSQFLCLFLFVSPYSCYFMTFWNPKTAHQLRLQAYKHRVNAMLIDLVSHWLVQAASPRTWRGCLIPGVTLHHKAARYSCGPKRPIIKEGGLVSFQTGPFALRASLECLKSHEDTNHLERTLVKRPSFPKRPFSENSRRLWLFCCFRYLFGGSRGKLRANFGHNAGKVFRNREML